jgi:cytochrome c oxidase cbb3-type subunit III
MRSRNRAAAAIFVVAIVLALGGCEEIDGTRAAVNQRNMQTRANHELGREIYNFRCYYCHGYSGDAQTLAASFLKPAPRSFKDSALEDLPRTRMMDVITHGREGTAMKSFAGILTPNQVSAVTDFVLDEFVRAKAHNTQYHTEANGWRDHERFKAAFPFATGKIALDAAIDTLSLEQREGRQLFMNACISCHDRAKVNTEGAAWAIRPVTYPPDLYLLAESGRAKEYEGFDPHHAHEKAPTLRGLTKTEKRGETLYQKNCAFCHAADGTGRNWIGSFLEPNASDLTSMRLGPEAKHRLAAVISEGVDGTSMPAWKNVLPEADIHAIAAYVTRAFSTAHNEPPRHRGHPRS